VTEGKSLQDARYAPPQAEVDDIEETTAGLVLATRWQRFGATLVDIVVGVAATWAAATVTPWDPWGDNAQRASLWQPMLLDTLVGFALFCVLHGLLLARRGQTIGKAVLGIRIMRSDGSAASLARLLGLRYGSGYALLVIPALGQTFGVIDALTIFRASRRCLHDVIADTVVVKA
jgi:uncharacterized RDD family membrane protein YckC